MPRNRHKKSQTGLSRPSHQFETNKTSPAAQAVANRITSGGADYLMQNIVRIMTDSAKLADEPEFIDLYLNGQQVTEVSKRWLKKYKGRLTAARRKGQDEYKQVFDDMRIKVIDELATPAFRKDVNNRLQTMVDRLKATDDTQKLEIVLFLKPLLSMESIPWGVCGLILAILGRTMDQTMEEEKDLETTIEALKAEGEETIDLLKIIESPKKFEQIGQKLLAANPDMLKRAERRQMDIVHVFEDELVAGKVDLDLFSEAELLLPFQHLQAETGESFAEVQPTEEMQQRIFDVIRQVIIEIMTPDRFQHLREDVESISKIWLREQRKWAAALYLELNWLGGKRYVENKFVLAAFIGQIERAGKEEQPSSKLKTRKH